MRARRNNRFVASGRAAGHAHLAPSLVQSSNSRYPPPCVLSPGRGGFTLIEMLVSLAVIALALAIVGVVFSVTTKTATQSAAYSEAHNWLRQFERELKADLTYCDPSQSVLVLVGRTQAAGLTKDKLEAGLFHRVLVGNKANVPSGYDPESNPNLDNPADPNFAQYSNPRADIMMFFSQRPTASAAPATSDATDPYAMGVKFAPIRVVYGHAALGSPVWDAGGDEFRHPYLSELRHIERPDRRVHSTVPAAQWHLARSAVIMERPRASYGIPSDIQFSSWAWSGGLGVTVCAPYFDQQQNWLMPGDAAFIDVNALLSSFGPASGDPNCSPYYFEDETLDVNHVATLRSLMYATHTGDPYVNTEPHHVATVLDELPAQPAMQTNIGVQMLPGCAWFQVEFLMPEDPRNSKRYVTKVNDPKVPDPSRRSDVPRWVPVQDGSTYVFVPDTEANRQAVRSNPLDPIGAPSGRLWTFGRLDQNETLHPQLSDAVSQRVIRMWPYAIRVTVHVYDPRGRLTEPIVRSIVHRFE